MNGEKENSYHLSFNHKRGFNVRHTYVFCLLMAVFYGCGESEEEKKDVGGYNQRVTFAMSGLTQNYEETDAAWEGIFAKAKDLGVQNLHLQVGTWEETEKAEGSYTLTFFDGFLEAMKEHPEFSYSLDVATPLGIGGPSVPSYLTFSTWDDSQMFEKYKGYLDAVFERLPEPTYVMLHTESAGWYFTESDHAGELAAFQTLLAKTAEHVKSVIPNAKIGVYGGKPESADILAKLNEATDYFGLTYIADRGDEDFEAQLRLLLGRAGDKPIVLVEAGVPTDERVGGSDDRQEVYVKTLFKLAKEFEQKLQYVSYYQAFDEDENVTRAYLPVQYPDWTGDTFEDAVKWFSSLGLYRSNGEPKPAVETFKLEMTDYLTE